MNQQNIENVTQDIHDNPATTLSDLIFIVLRHWYWFVLSIIVCLSVATLYLMSTPKIYERTATVLIKDDQSKTGETALFQDLTIFEGKNNVNNEMIVFKSQHLMDEAVRRLKIDVSYKTQNRLRLQELYSDTPVFLSFLDLEESQAASVKIRLLGDGKALLWEFTTPAIESQQEMIINLNDTVSTPIGKLIALPSLWYQEVWFDRVIQVTKSRFTAVANSYRGALSIMLADKQTSAIKLSIKDESISRAEDILNTVIAIYNEEAINEKNMVAINTEDFINKRLIIIESELSEVDLQIESYKQSQQITDLTSSAQLALQESSEFNRSISTLQNRRAMALYVHNYLTDPANSTEMLPANVGIEDMRLESQIMEYNQTLIRRNNLIESSSERSPIIQDYNTRLISMRQSIIRAVDNLIVNFDTQLRSLNASTERTRARISAVPQQQSQVTSISREQQIKVDIFQYLLRKREDNALNKAITESTARIVDSAIGSQSPIAPRSSIILMAAFMLGIVIPSSILYLVIISDVKVRGRKDLLSVLTVPFLGEIPFKKMKGKTIEEILIKQNGRDPISEAFRIIRTNMEYLRVKQEQLKVIVTTSTTPNSGKTFVASNLSVSLAMTGKKVLLIDMDIRKGTFGKLLWANNKKDEIDVGLTSYLSKIVNDMDAIIFQDANFPDIDIISSGPMPPNPAELLLSERLDMLIHELRKRYDYIVIDNVPCKIVADALISNRIADLTLYIVRAGKLDRRMLPEIEYLYREEKLKNMAMILNGVVAGSVYDYGYSYEYGYGY